MYNKIEFSEYAGQHSNKQNSSKSKLRESKEICCSEFKSKENDSKHMNAIKPYVTKERKNSKRDIRGNSSPYQINRSKSKKLETSSRKLEQSMNSKHLGQIYQELVNLKNQYKALKSSYNSLAKEKHQISNREEQRKEEYSKEKKSLESELQKYKKSSQSLTVQIDRIKKECFKILESEKFKNKKLEETLQQKELMISFLRNENECIKKNKEMMNGSQGENMEKIFFLQNSAPIFSYESYARMSANNSVMSINNNVLIDNQNTEMNPQTLLSHEKPKYRKAGEFEEDSLSFSKDKDKEFDSVHSLLSNNNDQTVMVYTKKDKVVLQGESSFEKKDCESEQSSISCKNQEDSAGECPTFENRNIDSKISLKVDSAAMVVKKSKNSRQHTKRLQILTENFGHLEDEPEALSNDPKKKMSAKSRKKAIANKKKK